MKVFGMKKTISLYGTVIYEKYRAIKRTVAKLKRLV